MKKIISILAAFTLMTGCFSCSEEKDTKSDSKPLDGDTSVTVTDGSAEEPVIQQQTELREFKEDDFKTINVNLSKTDKEPSFQLHSIKLNDIDFGERISPCKQGEYRDKYKPVFDAENNADDEYREYMEQANADWEKLCTEPTKGGIGFWRMCGNDIYAAVSYDQYCTGGLHDVSIFRVGGLTGKVTEIYRHSDPENSFGVDTIAAPNGKVYLSIRDKGLMYLDGGKLVPMNYLDGYSHYLMGDAADKMVFLSTKDILEQLPDDYEPQPSEHWKEKDGRKYLITGQERIYSEYLPDKDEWKEIARKTYTQEEVYSDVDPDYNFPRVYGKLAAHTEKPERKRKLDVVTDEYRISTGITGLDILYADHDRLVVKLSNKNIVHIFDMAKMEHYVLDCSGLATMCQYFEGGLFVYPQSGSGYIYYIMPEIGLTFTLCKLPEISDERVSMSFGAFRGDRSFGFQESIAIMKNEERDPDTGQIKHADYDNEEIIYWVNGDEMNG
ncbi:hypothetical protein [Ruminococcus sp.]|uniref:hypothetical protein n=1 Tax=Ruminococcus sp. TaxID=41978 RepID=UPI0025D313C9|nr:hypothetical protein [Ruminococcus sp.]MCR4639940.1 hypothetical protein [Ruminococcus sp.]